MIQKVIKVGSSLAVVLPKQLAKKHGITDADSVELTEKDGGIFYKPIKDKVTVDQDLLKWADKFSDEYAEALNELRDK